MSQDSARSGANVWFCGSDMHSVEYVDAKVVHCAWLTALSGFRLGGAAFQAMLSWLPGPAAWARVIGPAPTVERATAVVAVVAGRAWGGQGGLEAGKLGP